MAGPVALACSIFLKRRHARSANDQELLESRQPAQGLADLVLTVPPLHDTWSSSRRFSASIRQRPR